MRTLLCGCAALLALCAVPAHGGEPDDRAQIRAVLDDYVDGWHAGDAVRVERATHPELLRNKAALAGTDGTVRIETLDQLGLVTAARSGMGTRGSSAERARRATELFDTRGVSAVALVETGATFSYVQLVRDSGRWQILSVLWEPKAEPDEGPDLRDAAAVEATVRDYAEGWYSGDAARMARALHPDLVKRRPSLLDRRGRLRIDTHGRDEMLGFTRSGMGTRTPPDQRVKALRVLDMRGRCALAYLETGAFFDYLALVRDRGQWKIATVLWEPLID